MARKKVAFAIDTNTAGGAQRVVATLANGLAQLDCDVTIINSDDDSTFYELDPRVEVVKMRLDLEADGTRSIARLNAKTAFLKRWISTHRPDAMVPRLVGMELPAVFACRDSGTPVFASVCNSPRFYSSKTKRFRRWAYPRIAGVVFQSEAVRNHPDFADTRNGKVIPNPLAPEIAAFADGPVPFDQRKDRIISVGRLVDQKQPLMLLEAFAAVAQQHPRTELDYYGEGPLSQSIEKRAQELGLADRVHLRGVVPNAILNNRGARLFVLCSEMEGFPNVLAESMALGLPVISTDFDTGVAAELIDDGRNGWLVPVGDAQALAGAIDHALSLGEKTDPIAQAATRVRELLDPERICREWYDFMFPQG